jgi:hypothetical protein
MMKPSQISSKPHRKWRWGTLLIHLPLLTLEIGNEPYPFNLNLGNEPHPFISGMNVNVFILNLDEPYSFIFYPDSSTLQGERATHPFNSWFANWVNVSLFPLLFFLLLLIYCGYSLHFCGLIQRTYFTLIGF